MEITVIENKKNRLVAELNDLDHSFCNALKDELWNDKDVKVSAYSVDHPLVGVPKLILETSGKEAKKALEDACSRLEKTNKAFLAELSKAK